MLLISTFDQTSVSLNLNPAKSPWTLFRPHEGVLEMKVGVPTPLSGWRSHWLGWMKCLNEPEIDTVLTTIRGQKCGWGIVHGPERIYALISTTKRKKKTQTDHQTCYKKNSKLSKQKAVWSPTPGLSHSLTLPRVASYCCLWLQDYHRPPPCSSCHRALSPCVAL